MTARGLAGRIIERARAVVFPSAANYLLMELREGMQPGEGGWRGTAIEELR